jgi:hypothetical protein
VGTLCFNYKLGMRKQRPHTDFVLVIVSLLPYIQVNLYLHTYMNIGISDGRTFSTNYDPTVECDC